MSSWRIFPLQIHNPAGNMAIDESIYRLKIKDSSSIPNTIRFYRWKPSCVSIGKNQDLHTEIDTNACEENGIDIVRRITGGGAVFHMFEGEITYSIITNLSEIGISDSKECYYRVLTALSRALERLEIETSQGEIHCPALLSNNKKLSGNAQAMSGDVLLQHGTLLVKYNPELMYTVLKARPEKPRTKMIESVYAHVTTLEQLGVSTDFKLIAKYLKEGFIKEFKIKSSLIEDSTLSSDEDKLVRIFADERYSSPEWTEFKKESTSISNLIVNRL
ncbi:MAG: lipoate--protein ligase family protein [Candidatus Hodarchaeales archaeon]|jgi:lipoate-protein ligase A